MSDKLRCEIVQDLLPSYVDGLTSDETNEAVKDHLADCVSCRDMYELSLIHISEPTRP